MGDISNLVSALISESLETLPQLSSNGSIYVVPRNLRKVNEDAYRPLLVSIGPFYRTDTRLSTMRQQKLRYLQSFLRRSTSYNLEYYVQVIRGWEFEARQCYVENLELLGLSSVQFIDMLLVDAAFIIELFWRGCFPEYIEENDRIFNKPRMILEITRDVRLEENQIPFFVLKGLYDLAFMSSSQNYHQYTFIDITYKFFWGKNETTPPWIQTSNVEHLVDFLRLCHLPSELRLVQSPTTDQRFEFTSSVTELSEAGVMFVASASENLLDVKFIKGVLEIPRFVVTGDTESYFRNIMAFEQCHYFDSYIIDYFAFLDSLINSPKDVAILVQRGVIENWLGNNEKVAKMFSKIFNQTGLKHSNFYYSSVCKELNAYANTPWNRFKAILKNNYFNHRWTAISIVYAIVMLILTVIQAVTGF